MLQTLVGVQTSPSTNNAMGKLFSDMYYLIFLRACIFTKCIFNVAKRSGDFTSHVCFSHGTKVF